MVLPTSFRIRVRLQNLKSGFQNLNPDFPIKHDLIFRVIFFRTPLKVQSNAVNTDTEGPYRQSVLINGVSILSGLNLEKMEGLSFTSDKKEIVRKAGFDCV